MKILVLGNGAREHAIAWKLKQSPQCQAIYLHPGNAGTQQFGFKPLELSAFSKESVAVECKKLGIDLVVIGPEVLLAEGYADHLRSHGLCVFGPDKAAAQLETSKVFAKEFMRRAEIPTAPFVVVSSMEEFMANVPSQYPVVLKLDGLAAGKGVVIANNKLDATHFAKRVWEEQEFGEGPHRIVVEAFIPGLELSYLGFCDGDRFFAMATATDYKRVFDQDEGPNTGGMGAISPSPYFNDPLAKKIRETIVTRILNQMKRENISYRGVLYIGLMIDREGNPFVLEFNTRFGDPETQAILPRLESDFVTPLIATATGQLHSCAEPTWSPLHSVYIVGAAEGYPASPKKGDSIHGLDSLPLNTTLFFSGVDSQNGALVTCGGRVLGIGALGKDLKSARSLAYDGIVKVNWRGMHYRKDIGKIAKENPND